MMTMQVRLDATEGDLLDIAEEIERLLDGCECCPTLRRVLVSIDDAITASFVHDSGEVAA